MTTDMILARWTPAFLLMLARCGGVVAVGPVFGSRTLPPTLKAGLAGALALMLAPLVEGTRLQVAASGWTLAVALLGEVTIGLVLGLAVRFTFAGIALAGEMAAIQMGVGLPAALDPHSMTQVSAVNHLLDQIAVLTFLGVGGHQAVLAALAQSLTLAPPASVGWGGEALRFLLGLFQAAYLLAIRIAAPVSMAMLATTVALGLLNRVAPQVNVFLLSFAVTIGVGILVLLAALPVQGAVMAESFRELPARLAALLARMRYGL
jgi:flagellar biosynthetic protein FliR